MKNDTLTQTRAGEVKLAWNHPKALGRNSIVLTSSAFAQDTQIPSTYEDRGEQTISPPIAWDNVHPRVQELVLIIADPDALGPEPFVHAIVYGIPTGCRGFEEGALSSGKISGTFGRNSMGETKYIGPMPPPGHGPHRYAFQVFGLSEKLELKNPPNRKELLEALDLHRYVIYRGRLDGIYER